MILVVGEARGGNLNRSSWEAVAAAQQLAGGEPVAVAVLGANVAAAAAELAHAQVAEVIAVENPARDPYTPDGYVVALQQTVEPLDPSIVLLAHTYQTRDYAPTIAARMARALVTDVIRFRVVGEERRFARPMFQGKVTAEVVPLGPRPHFVTLQVGAFRADQAARAAQPAPIRSLSVQLEPGAIRQQPEAPFQEARQAVDLSQASRIVSVGRGIKEAANIGLVQRLADASGA